VSLFCTIWNHLDWELFEEIAKEQAMSADKEWDMEKIEEKDEKLFE